MKKQTLVSRGGLAAFALAALFTACGGKAVQDSSSTPPNSSAGKPGGGTSQPVGVGAGGGTGRPAPTGSAGSPPSASGGAAGSSSKPTQLGCAAGSIDFKLLVRSGTGTVYCVGDQDSCMPDWLSIRPVGGADLPIEPDRCKGSCDTCSAFGCDALCVEPAPLGPNGIERIFTGVYAPSGVCGANLVCNDSACIAPGQYVAKLCGYPASLSGPVSAPTQQCDFSRENPACVEIPFSWPPSATDSTLTGTIGDLVYDGGGAAGAPSDE
jgi:hypothetical protein